MDQLIFLKIQL